MPPKRWRRYRDPVHGDLDFDGEAIEPHVAAVIGTRAFQRLRHIRQNGVTNLVFHGAEHSRFAHSMGVAWLAGRMHAAVATRGTDAGLEEHLQTILAGLLHDVGHGPFSHGLEEILSKASPKEKFDHERMTVRLLEEEDSEIADALRRIDKALPARLAEYIDKSRRKGVSWYHSIVSSQLDADRLDYLMRDSLMAGIHAHRVDAARLISALRLVEVGDPAMKLIAVDVRAMDILENYVLALDHMYEYVYFHKTVRAANFALESTIHRVIDLGREDKKVLRRLFPGLGADHPMWQLARDGSAVSLPAYCDLDEAMIWALLPAWQAYDDTTLSRLAAQLRTRSFPKPIDLTDIDPADMVSIVDVAREASEEKNLDCKYFVRLDDPARVGYKRYSLGEGPATSILVVGRDGAVRGLEQYERSITNVVARRNLFAWLHVPHEIHATVQSKADATRKKK